MAKRWAAAVQAGNSVIAFSVPEAGLPALNQKRQSLSVMAQLIIKHVSYLRRAPPIYFHLSDRDGCTNSISTINKGSINISPFLQKQITQLINCPMSVNSNNPEIIKDTSHILLVFSTFSKVFSLPELRLLANPSAFRILLGVCTFLIFQLIRGTHELLFRLSNKLGGVRSKMDGFFYASKKTKRQLHFALRVTQKWVPKPQNTRAWP